jgi:hypothetical protein
VQSRTTTSTPRPGWRVEAGLRRGQPRTVGTRQVTVLAWSVGVSWRGASSGCSWGVVRPLAVQARPVEPTRYSRFGSLRGWRVIPDPGLVALVGGLALLVWLARSGRQPARRRR